MIQKGFVANQTQDLRKLETLCIREQSTHILFTN
jgi:hypothetical protein